MSTSAGNIRKPKLASPRDQLAQSQWDAGKEPARRPKARRSTARVVRGMEVQGWFFVVVVVVVRDIEAVEGMSIESSARRAPANMLVPMTARDVR